jgi:hypothetical protein
MKIARYILRLFNFWRHSNKTDKSSGYNVLLYPMILLQFTQPFFFDMLMIRINKACKGSD